MFLRIYYGPLQVAMYPSTVLTGKNYVPRKKWTTANKLPTDTTGEMGELVLLCRVLLPSKRLLNKIA